MFLSKNRGDVVDRELEKLIIQLLWRSQEGFCGNCGIKLYDYETHHKNYDSITLYDLTLLCRKCHLSEHNKVMRKEPRKRLFHPIINK